MRQPILYTVLAAVIFPEAHCIKSIPLILGTVFVWSILSVVLSRSSTSSKQSNQPLTQLTKDAL